MCALVGEEGGAEEQGSLQEWSSKLSLRGLGEEPSGQSALRTKGARCVGGD